MPEPRGGTTRVLMSSPSRPTRTVMRFSYGYTVRNGRCWARTSDPQLVDSAHRRVETHEHMQSGMDS